MRVRLFLSIAISSMLALLHPSAADACGDGNEKRAEGGIYGVMDIVEGAGPPQCPGETVAPTG